MDIIVNDNCAEVPDRSTPLTCEGDAYSQLLVLLGYDKYRPPVAEMLRRHCGLDGTWVVVSPIHWQATHNDALIMAYQHELDLSYDDAYVLYQAFQEFVTPDMETYFFSPYHWLLRVDGKPAIHAKPTSVILRQSMMPELERLDDQLYWQRFITECQMLLSNHPLNVNRTQCPINGVWLWGQGDLTQASKKPVICMQPSILPLLAKVSENAAVIKPHQRLPKKSILFIDNDMNIDTNQSERFIETLTPRLNKKSVHWYWNNVAYRTKRQYWWSRIWSS